MIVPEVPKSIEKVETVDNSTDLAVVPKDDKAKEAQSLVQKDKEPAKKVMHLNLKKIGEKEINQK